MLPDPILQKALDGKVRRAGAIRESHKGGRRHGRLGQIIKPQRFASGTGRPLKMKLLHKPIHLGRGDSIVAGGRDLQNCIEQLMNSVPR